MYWFNDIIMGLLSDSRALYIIIIIVAAEHKLTSVITNHCILMYNYRENEPHLQSAVSTGFFMPTSSARVTRKRKALQ